MQNIGFKNSTHIINIYDKRSQATCMTKVNCGFIASCVVHIGFTLCRAEKRALCHLMKYASTVISRAIKGDAVLVLST